MNAFEASCKLMPPEFRQDISKFDSAEEIRLRYGQRPSVILCGKETYISEILVKTEHISHVIALASEASIHAASEHIKHGYLNYRGLRVGVCGEGVYRENRLIGFRKYTSVSIRIPHQSSGMVPEEICKKLMCHKSNTLIAAAPGVGKTTALREIVRYLSEQGTRISLIDERGEFTGEWCPFELGRCTDVLSFVPKAEGCIYMLRSMNPELIAMDEISKSEDLKTVFDIIGCGVNVFATVHGTSLQDMLRRPWYRKLVSESIVENLITISIDKGVRHFYMDRLGV